MVKNRFTLTSFIRRIFKPYKKVILLYFITLLLKTFISLMYNSNSVDALAVNVSCAKLLITHEGNMLHEL